MLPIGHTERIYSAVYSPVTASDPVGGKFILTASADKTLMLWSAQDGKLIKKYEGHDGSAHYACFSPDGKQIISGSDDETMKVWNIETGEILASYDKLGDGVQYIAVNPLLGKPGDNNTIIICTNRKGAFIKRLDDAASMITIDSSLQIRSANFSPDGKYFVTTATDDPEIRIWDSKKAMLIRKQRVGEASALTAAFSTDGQTIITCSKEGAVCKWDARTGQKIIQVKQPVFNVLSAALSSDGKYIATCSMGGVTTLFNAQTGERIREWQAGDGQQSFIGVANVSFNPSGNQLLTLSGHSAVKIWLAETGKLVNDIKNHTSIALYTAYSPSGNIITTIHEDGSLRSWNATNGRLLGRARKHQKFTCNDYSPANTSMGSKYLAYSSYDSIAYYQLRNDSAELQKLVGHHGKINTIAFSPDGNNIVTASDDSTAIIWRVTSRGNGEIVYILKGHKAFVVGASYSPDGKHIVTSSYDRTAVVWSTATGKTEHVLTGHNGQVVSARYSSDSKKIVTTSYDDTVRIWDANNYRLLSTITSENGVITDASFKPSSISDSAGNTSILTCGPGNVAGIWDAASGKKIKELKGHTDLVSSANYSRNDRYIITSSYDNYCKVWDAGSGKLLYNFIAVDSADYLVTDEDGRYDGSTAARKMMYLTCGTEIVDLDQFKDLAWEPGLAAKLLGNNKEPITAKNIRDTNLCRLTPEVITLPMDQNNYRYKIIPRRAGVGDIEVYVNGKLVKTVDTSGLKKDQGAFLLSVSANELSGYFVAGESNEVEVKANTANGQVSSRGVSIIRSATPVRLNQNEPKLYIVSIGISLYKGDVLKLNYASKDAGDFSKALEAAGKNLLDTNGKQHVFTYTLNTEPGNANWPLKNTIHSVIDSVVSKATSSDIMVLFFAGHGVMPANEKSLYLLTAEATSFEMDSISKAEVTISTDELIDWMRKIKAGKQVLILDACNSGQVIQNMQSLIGRGEIPADQQRALQNLQDKSGTYILSASASGQSAYESGVYNQGLLTYSLLSGLKLGDGLREAKFVDLTRWFNNAASSVQVLAKDIGGRQDPQIFGNTSFDVGLVDSKLKEEIVLPAKKKVFGAALFIGNIDNLDDSLGLSEMVDREMINRTAMGSKSQIAFAPSSKLQNTWYIRGRYKVSANTVMLQYQLYEDKAKKKEFTLEAVTTDLNTIPMMIADEMEKYFAAGNQ